MNTDPAVSRLNPANLLVRTGERVFLCRPSVTPLSLRYKAPSDTIAAHRGDPRS
jgi:hypothetical protein